MLPEVCQALLELDGHGGSSPGHALRQADAEAEGPDPAQLRATATTGLRRLRRYARTFPMARPRALAGFQAAGCSADARRVQGLAGLTTS